MALFSLNKIFGSVSQSFLKSAEPLVKTINSLESEFSALKDEDFPARTVLFKERLQKGETLDELLPEAFALVREATKRARGWRQFDVQLIGGIALHQGKIAEMRTGEGKTLVATMPVYLNSLLGRGVHVVTVNDFLARRDAVWMGEIYALLGLSIGVINSLNSSFIYDPGHTEKDKQRDEVGSFKIVYEFLRPTNRREAYAADVTYGTNNEFGFDYLRDNLVYSLDQVSQRDHCYAIVDEVDSILIDEARTPLIISSEAEESDRFYRNFSSIATKLAPEIDYTVDEKLRAISLTDEGINKAEKMLGVENIYTEKGVKYVHHLETAVRAQALFLRDRDYVLKPARNASYSDAGGEGEVVIVDPFTGRLQPGRRWSDGLHQAIEAKEGVQIQKETKAVASITFQNYFRFYEKLSGMTGTAITSQEEFHKVYNLDVIEIPTNKPSQRNDKNDLIFQTEKGKFQAVARMAKELHQKGQPLLIGTVSVEKNEILSAYLSREGAPHQILNAKNHEKEGEIIASAGAKGSIVLATNLAGRGIDIKLGGVDATAEQAKEIKDLGGLFVLGTERHEARRIDNQLRGRAGRQGDPGETQFFVSLEDDLMRVFGSERIKNMMGRLGIPEDQPIENKIVSRAIESAQAKIEGFNFDARKHTLEYDDVMNLHRKMIYERRKSILSGDQKKVEDSILDLFKEDTEALEKIEKKKEEVGEEGFWQTAKRIILYVTDVLWVEHLEIMEYTRSSVNLRAYGQREPLTEYKKEGLRLFKEMEIAFKEQVMDLISTMKKEASVQKKEEVLEQKTGLVYNSSSDSSSNAILKSPNKNVSPEGLPAQAGQKLGRNDPCWCGSKKKYKKCHGK